MALERALESGGPPPRNSSVHSPIPAAGSSTPGAPMPLWLSRPLSRATKSPSSRCESGADFCFFLLDIEAGGLYCLECKGIRHEKANESMAVRELSVQDAHSTIANSDNFDSSTQMYGEAQPTATDIIMAKEYLNQVSTLGCHVGVARWEKRDYTSTCAAEANIMLIDSLPCRRLCCPLTRFAVSVRPT